jgi:hypothetical protein
VIGSLAIAQPEFDRAAWEECSFFSNQKSCERADDLGDPYTVSKLFKHTNIRLRGSGGRSFHQNA